MRVYRYTESGLDNVIIRNMPIIVDDTDDEVISIPNVNLLHKIIAKELVTKKTSLTGKELRFLRTEIGKTQADLGEIVHCKPLTIGRWEREEHPIERNAEVVIRRLVTETLKLNILVEIQEISRWCVPGETEETPLTIEGSDPTNYHRDEAA